LRIKDSPSRLDGARKAAEKEGGKIQAWYLTMGQYDALLISEFPSEYSPNLTNKMDRSILVERLNFVPS